MGSRIEPARATPTDLVRGRVERLDTSELLAVCLGGRPERLQGAASELLERFEIARLSRVNADELRRTAGVSVAAAERLAAAFELGRRVEDARSRRRPSLRSPARVHELMRGELRGLERETFHALLLDSQHRLRRRCRVSEGTLTSSLVHPREVFAPALREAAAAIIVVHNHPSGDPEPSAEDLAVTRRLIDAGRLLGVPLLDHVVVADGGYVSIRERMGFEAEPRRGE